MKSWTVSELNNVVGALKPLIGLRLQEVQTSSQDVVLGFYSPTGMLWLWIDLNAISPCLLPWTALPLRPQVQKTPLNLFLRAHFVDKVLRAIRVSEEKGRLVYLEFAHDVGGAQLELRLLPGDVFTVGMRQKVTAVREKVQLELRLTLLVRKFQMDEPPLLCRQLNPAQHLVHKVRS